MFSCVMYLFSKAAVRFITVSSTDSPNNSYRYLTPPLKNRKHKNNNGSRSNINNSNNNTVRVAVPDADLPKIKFPYHQGDIYICN